MLVYAAHLSRGARPEAFDEAIEIVKRQRDKDIKAAEAMNPGPMGFIDRDDEERYWAFRSHAGTADDIIRNLEAAKGKSPEEERRTRRTLAS